MKVSPRLTELNGVDGGFPTFTFTDDPDWRAALTGLKLYINGTWMESIILTDFDEPTPGNISTVNLTYSSGFTFKWVFEATGYRDETVTVVTR